MFIIVSITNITIWIAPSNISKYAWSGIGNPISAIQANDDKPWYTNSTKTVAANIFPNNLRAYDIGSITLSNIFIGSITAIGFAYPPK